MALELAHIEEQIAQMRKQLDEISGRTPENRLSMVVFSGDLDKVLASFVLATGAVAMGMEVAMFFTFWATPILRDAKKKEPSKDLMGAMFGKMLPKGMGAAKLSRMNMGGMGTAMMKSLMKQKNVASLEDLLAIAAELGVKIYVCEMSMNLMGFTHEEMIDYPGLDYVGVATFLELAMTSRVQLFI